MLFSWLPDSDQPDLEEVGIHEHRRRRHEAAARVAPDPDFVDVDERVAGGELLDGGLLVREAVVAQVAVAVVVVPLRPLRMAAAVADLDDDEPELRERDVVAARIEVLRHAFGLRTRIDVGDDRYFFARSKSNGLCITP